MGDHEDQPTNSMELEVDSQEQDVGPGVRSYECVFCKRGFTTAQALGGHMNIHRKDRAKSSRPNYLSNNNSSKQEDHSFYGDPRFYYPIFTSYPQSYVSTTPNHQEGNICYYTSSTSSTARVINHENNHQDVHDGVIVSPSREEEIMSSSLQFGWSHGEDKDSRRRIRGGNKEDELDLELRLGQI